MGLPPRRKRETHQLKRWSASCLPVLPSLICSHFALLSH